MDLHERPGRETLNIGTDLVHQRDVGVGRLLELLVLDLDEGCAVLTAGDDQQATISVERGRRYEVSVDDHGAGLLSRTFSATEIELSRIPDFAGEKSPLLPEIHSPKGVSPCFHAPLSSLRSRSSARPWDAPGHKPPSYGSARCRRTVLPKRIMRPIWASSLRTG